MKLFVSLAIAIGLILSALALAAATVSAGESENSVAQGGRNPLDGDSDAEREKERKKRESEKEKDPDATTPGSQIRPINKRLSGKAGSEEVDDFVIQQAIQRGITHLLSYQNDKGQWSTLGEQIFLGMKYDGPDEACAMMALAHAGVSMNNPKMQKGLDALLDQKLQRTYVVALRAIVIAKLMPKLDPTRAAKAREVLKKDVQFLERGQRDTGGWGYPLDIGPKKVKDQADKAIAQFIANAWDLSNTQFAILALAEANGVGVEVSPPIMKKAQDLYLKAQGSGGGWNYGVPLFEAGKQAPDYGSMTAAGVASLFLTRDVLVRNSGCPCKDGLSGSRNAPVDQAIDRGLGWLGKNFNVQLPCPGFPEAVAKIVHDKWNYYWLYACERAGLASGVKYFGKHDWYREGAQYILSQQRPGGDWGSVSDTAFALAFLVKGRTPILFNKLQFAGDWNSHPRDIANLVAFVAHEKEQALRWQVVSFDAPVAELHDAPILYISAEAPLNLKDADKKKLREFADTGGTILFEASCGNKDSADYWKKTCQEIWPEFAMEKLPVDHPIYSCDARLKSVLPEFYGLDDGLRTFMFVSLADLSCPWQTQAVVKQKPLFDIGSNFFIYSTDRRPLRAHLTPRNLVTQEAYLGTKLAAGHRTALKMVRLKHGGDWQIGGHYQAQEKLAKEVSSGLRLSCGENSAAELAELNPEIVYLTARKSLTLPEADLAALKKYLAGGGLLLAEANMGDQRFDDQFRPLAKQLGLEMKLIKITDPFLSGEFAPARGFSIASVKFKFALRNERVGNFQPELYLLTLDGKAVGLYSPFDLLFSLCGYDAYGNRGYEDEDARAILTNFVLWATAPGAAAIAK